MFKGTRRSLRILVAKIVGLTVNDPKDLKYGTNVMYLGRPAKIISDPKLDEKDTIVHRVEVTFRDYDGFRHSTARFVYRKGRSRIHWRGPLAPPRYPGILERFLYVWW